MTTTKPRRSQRGELLAARKHLEQSLGWLRGYPLLGPDLRWCHVPSPGLRETVAAPLTPLQLDRARQALDALPTAFPRAWRDAASRQRLRAIAQRLERLRELLDGADPLSAPALARRWGAPGKISRCLPCTPLASALVWLWAESPRAATRIAAARRGVAAAHEVGALRAEVLACDLERARCDLDAWWTLWSDPRVEQVATEARSVPSRMLRVAEGELPADVELWTWPDLRTQLQAWAFRAHRTTSIHVRTRLFQESAPAGLLDAWDHWWSTLRGLRREAEVWEGDRAPLVARVEAWQAQTPRTRLYHGVDASESWAAAFDRDALRSLGELVGAVLASGRDPQAALNAWHSWHDRLPARALPAVFRLQARLLGVLPAEGQAWVSERLPQRLANGFAAQLRQNLPGTVAFLEERARACRAWSDHWGFLDGHAAWGRLAIATERFPRDLERAWAFCEAVSEADPDLSADDFRLLQTLFPDPEGSGEQVRLIKRWDLGGLGEGTRTALRALCADPRAHALLAVALDHGYLNEVQELTARWSLVRLLTPGVRFTAPPARADAPAGVERRLHDAYPAALRGELTALARWDLKAEASARAVLAKDFPDPRALRRERDSLKALLARPAFRGAGLESRLRSLERRLSRDGGVSPRRLERYRRKLEARVALARIRGWIVAATRDVQAAARWRLGDPLPRGWFKDAGLVRRLGALGGLDCEFRPLVYRVLRARLGPAPWSLDHAPANRAWCARMRARGVDLTPWLGTRRRRKHGAWTYQLELDPLEVLRMGEHFGTCLSPEGDFYYSALVNAADANKRVLYARDKTGLVQGRCLLALSERGQLLTYRAYVHDPEGGFVEGARAYVADLATDLGVELARSGHVEPLVGPDWYDDGSSSFAVLPTWLENFRAELTGLDPGQLGPRLLELHEGRALNAATWIALLDDKAFTQRAPLLVAACELILAGERVDTDLRLDAAQRAQEAGQRELCVALLDPLVRSGGRVAAPYDVARLLLDCGQPAKALRVLRRVRIGWSRGGAARAVLAADILLALKRRQAALRMLRLAAGQGADVGARIKALSRHATPPG